MARTSKVAAGQQLLYQSHYKAVYYGTPPFGHRLHLSDTVYYSTGRETWAARSYCGLDIETYREDQAPPERVSEFCRNCFRSLAWEMFEESVKHYASEMDRRPNLRVVG